MLRLSKLTVAEEAVEETAFIIAAGKEALTSDTLTDLLFSEMKQSTLKIMVAKAQVTDIQRKFSRLSRAKFCFLVERLPYEVKEGETCKEVDIESFYVAISDREYNYIELSEELKKLFAESNLTITEDGVVVGKGTPLPGIHKVRIGIMLSRSSVKKVCVPDPPTLESNEEPSALESNEEKKESNKESNRWVKAATEKLIALNVANGFSESWLRNINSVEPHKSYFKKSDAALTKKWTREEEFYKNRKYLKQVGSEYSTLFGALLKVKAAFVEGLDKGTYSTRNFENWVKALHSEPDFCSLYNKASLDVSLKKVFEAVKPATTAPSLQPSGDNELAMVLVPASQTPATTAPSLQPSGDNELAMVLVQASQPAAITAPSLQPSGDNELATVLVPASQPAATASRLNLNLELFTKPQAEPSTEDGSPGDTPSPKRQHLNKSYF